MKEELNIVVLSALLHDVGKFAQRAKRPFSENMMPVYLTHYKGQTGHWHTLYTDYFIENDLPLPEYLETSRSKIARIASAHHRPDDSSLSEMCIMIADRLSSGSERIAYETSETKEGFRQSRLVSIFDEVELVKHNFKPPGNAFYKLTELNPESEEFFPNVDAQTGLAQDYIALFDNFLAELKQIKTNLIFQFYLDGLISVLEKYAWAIPSSSYHTIPDVSLFDHSLSTACFTQAIFMFHSEQNTIPKFNDSEKEFALLCGDLSGIQNYIFSINRDSGRGVSKIFRARSFYIQAVTRSVLIEIQRKAGLLSVCRLVDSGGKFILLLPANESIINEIQTLILEINHWFLKKFKGSLTMNFSEAMLVNQTDFKIDNFQNTIEALNESLDRVKFQKLKGIFLDHGPVISEDYDKYEEGNCSICAVNASDDFSTKKYKKEEGFEEELAIRVCTDCCEQIVYIGKELPTTKFLLYNKDHGRIPLFHDIKLTLLKNEPRGDLHDAVSVEALEGAGKFKRIRLARYLPAITEEEMIDEKWFKLFNQEDDRQIKAGQHKTFSMIAHKSKKKDKEQELKGRSLLGIFKADVDNLGLLFNPGLEGRLSAARFTSLSRMLEIFFAEYIVELAKKEYPDIYIVFAGGDDLFMVGPWHQSIEFAIMLRKKFRQFCAHNQDITLSGGILAAKPRLPMREAADIVESHLERAKKYQDSERLKDSVCFLGEVFSWDELEELMALGRKFDKAVQDKKRTNFTTAFLYRLLQYHKMYRQFVHGKQFRAGRYLALAHYDIGRNLRSDKLENQEEINMLEDIFAVGVSTHSELEKLNVPLFYAINLNRE